MNTMGKKSKKRRNNEIIIYKTETCPYCHMAMDFFKENGISYKEVDVGKDEKAAQRMIRESGQMGVPVINIMGKIIVGFDKSALKKALKIK